MDPESKVDMNGRDPSGTTPPRHRKGPRRLLYVLAGLVVLVLVIRVVLDPIAAWATRKALAKSPGFRAAFSDVHLSIIPPGYEIRRFKLIEEPGGRWDEPLVFVERTYLTVLWRELLRGHLVGRVVLEKPKAVAVRRHEEKAKKAPALSKQLEDMAPFRLDRLEIEDGEVLIAQGKGKKAPQLWLNNLNLVAANLATRKAMMEGEPAVLSLRGTVQRGASLTVDGSMDPWSVKPTFTVEAALKELKVQQLHAFIAENAEMRPVSGVINLFAKIKARNGVLQGGVKPVFENLELRPGDDDLGTRLKTFLADTAIEILSDDIPNRDAVATVIPIKGTLDQPDVQLVPTILGVVRNAFVVGLAQGFSNLPPKTAPKKEGIIRQAVDALKRDEGPPQAQPTPADQEKKKAPPKRARRAKPKPRR
jgi:hypothetical protein